MFETERVGMKHLARGGVVRLGAESNVLSATVGSVARQRETEVLEVHADLMSAAGMKDDLNEGGGAESFEDAKTGARFATFAGISNGHGAAMRWMTGDGGLDFTGSFR